MIVTSIHLREVEVITTNCDKGMHDQCLLEFFCFKDRGTRKWYIASMKSSIFISWRNAPFFFAADNSRSIVHQRFSVKKQFSFFFFRVEKWYTFGLCELFSSGKIKSWDLDGWYKKHLTNLRTSLESIFSWEFYFVYKKNLLWISIYDLSFDKWNISRQLVGSNKT